MQSVSVDHNAGKPVKDRDIKASNMINACKVQNIVPMTELNRYAIDFNATPSSAWSDIKGVKFGTDELGYFQTSDFNKFVAEGGYFLEDFPKNEFLNACGYGAIQSFQNKIKGK